MRHLKHRFYPPEVGAKEFGQLREAVDWKLLSDVELEVVSSVHLLVNPVHLDLLERVLHQDLLERLGS